MHKDELIQLIAEGYSVKMISYKMNLSENTIKTYRKQLMKEYGAVNAPNLVFKYLTNKSIKNEKRILRFNY